MKNFSDIRVALETVNRAIVLNSSDVYLYDVRADAKALCNQCADATGVYGAMTFANALLAVADADTVSKAATDLTSLYGASVQVQRDIDNGADLSYSVSDRILQAM